MVDDPKVQFYLTHRALIQEWATLADPAAQALEQALLAATHELAADDRLPPPRVEVGGVTFVKLDITTAPLPGVWFELAWERRHLLRQGPGTWPSLRLVTSPQEAPELRTELRNVSAVGLSRHGLSQSSSSWWLRHGDLVPEVEPIDVDGFARDCLQRTATVYLEMHAPIRQVVERFAGGVPL